MRIGITGSRGFIGRAVGKEAEARGHEVVGFSRSADGDRVRRFGEGMDVSGLDAIVHLAGEPILGLWTGKKRERIERSRVEGTRWVVEAIRAAGSEAPGVLVSGSATGLYGDRGDERLDEAAGRGEGFLADVVERWEAEADRARELCRVAKVRTGVVLGRGGGAAPMLGRVFGFGLGGRLGNGRQWMPWIHLDDEVRAILEAVENAGLEGAVNLAAPEPVRNRDFTKAMGQVLRRPAVLPVPGFALRASDATREMLTFSQRVVPAVLEKAGFEFRYPHLGDALGEVFG